MGREKAGKFSDRINKINKIFGKGLCFAGACLVGRIPRANVGGSSNAPRKVRLAQDDGGEKAGCAKWNFAGARGRSQTEFGNEKAKLSDRVALTTAFPDGVWEREGREAKLATVVDRRYRRATSARGLSCRSRRGGRRTWRRWRGRRGRRRAICRGAGSSWRRWRCRGG